MMMQRSPIMTAEVKVDCYSGKNCDEQKKFFNIYCAGDKQDDDCHEPTLTITLADLPPGARVLVEYPCCPKCEWPREDVFEVGKGITGHAEKCHYGFDWMQWVEEQYV